MKLWHHMKKRLAKKCIGDRWWVLNIGINLKVGDMVHGCFGWNDVIREIEPQACNWYRKTFKKGWYIGDFDIVTDSGACSLTHCCTFPIPTKDQIMEYWKHLAANSEYIKEWVDKGSRTKKIIDAINNGECPFDEKGMLLDEYRVKDEENSEST